MGSLLMTDVLPNPLTPRAAAELVRDGVRLAQGGSRPRDEQLARETEAELYGRGRADRTHGADLDDAERRLRRPGHDAETEAQIEDARSRLAHPAAGRPVRRDEGEHDDGGRTARPATADMGDESKATYERLFGGRRAPQPAAPDRPERPASAAKRVPGGPFSTPGLPPSMRTRRPR